MAGIEKIKEEILSSAKQKADSIIKEANLKAEEILETAKIQADEMKQDVLENASNSADSIKSNAESAIVLDKKNKILQTKMQLINEAFNNAESKLCSLDTKDYFEVIKKLIVFYAVKGEGEIILNEKDKKAMPKGFIEDVSKLLGDEKTLKLSKDFDNSIKGGLIIKYKEIEINCEFKAIIDSQRERLIDVVNNCLFN